MTQRIQRLLDGARLEGVHGVERQLGPIRRALAVGSANLTESVDLIGRVCQQWGGARHLLVPAPEEGATQFESPWHELLLDSVIDQVGAPESVDDQLYKLPDVVSWYVSTLLTLVTFSGFRKDEWHPVRVAVIEPDNPWFLSYLGTCGVWPEAPHTEAFNYMNLREDVSFDDFLETSREEIATPGAEDLLQRIRDARHLTPREATMLLLARRRWVTRLTGGGEQVIPTPHPVADGIGPNVVVVYEQGSVDDLCLLWNLRAASDNTLGFPLAVPNRKEAVQAVEYWMAEACWHDLDGTGPHLALTSFSVDADDLRSLADSLDDDWDVVSPSQLLVGSDRPFRSSSDVATFDQGRGRVAAWHPTDRTDIGYSGHSMAHHLRTRINLEGERLPRSRALQGDRFSRSTMYVHGGADFAAQDPQKLLTVTWPSGWEAIEAPAKDRGLDVRPSVPGAAAAALIRRLGTVDDLEALVSPRLLAHLARMSERQGTSYFKKRVREIAKEVAGKGEDLGEALNAILDQLRKVEAPDEDADPRAITVDGMRATFENDRSSTERWLAWAEARQLIVRGGSVQCNECGASRWRSIRDLEPPINCTGCGARINQPFRADQLTFRYILGEPLRRALDLDVMTHLLAMRYFFRLYHQSFGKASHLYGAYPGVEFVDPSSNEVVGEADVLLVFIDGELVPGECKLHAGGLNEAELKKIEALTTRLESRWSFLATFDSSSDAASWKEWRRALPESPRFVLTGEHLFKSIHDIIIDEHPLLWQEASEEARADRHRAFVHDLSRLLDILPSPPS